MLLLHSFNLTLWFDDGIILFDIVSSKATSTFQASLLNVVEKIVITIDFVYRESYI